MPKKTVYRGVDPRGISQHEPGAKLDGGKQLAGLVLGDFAQGIKKVIEVGTYGAVKYTKSGWLQVPDGFNRYKDALYRHLLAMETEECDPESGLSHLSHAGWNILAMLELTERNKKEV